MQIKTEIKADFKRMRRLTVFVVMAMLMMGIMTGCAKPEEQSGDGNQSIEGSQSEAAVETGHYPVTITTYNYKKEPVEITFEKAPEKVFAVYQNSIETLLALGLEERIVAAAGLDQNVKPEYEKAFDRVNYLTEFAPDKESVIMMEPDLILSWHSYFSEKNLGDVDYWHGNGVNTYMMMNSGCAPERTLENEFKDILNLGMIFDVEEKAEAIVGEMKSEISTILEKTKGASTKPKVLLMEVEKDGVRVYGDNTLGGDMVRKLGAELVTADGNKMSSEALIAADPDVIFTVYFGSSDSIADAEAAIKKITEEPEYKSLQAVRRGRVHAIPLGEMYCSGTRTLDGIRTLAEGIYGGALH